MLDSQWERRVVLIGLVGALWLSLGAAGVLIFSGQTVPTEIYLMATALMIRMISLVSPAPPPNGNGLDLVAHKTTTGGSAEPPVVGK